MLNKRDINKVIQPTVKPTVKPIIKSIPAKIYGAYWDGNADPICSRTGDAAGMVANPGVDNQVVRNDFDSAEIYKDITQVTDSYGNVFIRIPRVWIKKTQIGASMKWEVSKEYFDGAYLPACYINTATGKVNDYVDIGKYPASLSTDQTKLESKTGVYPYTNATIVTLRGKARAYGNSANQYSGYQLFDIHMVDLLQALFVVEFATLNSQSIATGWGVAPYDSAKTAVIAETNINRIVISNASAGTSFFVGMPIGIGSALGNGSVCICRTVTSISQYDDNNKAIYFDGAPVNIAVGNIVYGILYVNGGCDTVLATTGSKTSLTGHKYPMKYRNIENLWGNMGQFIDGINSMSPNHWVCNDAAQYASGVFAAPYCSLGVNAASASGYIKRMDVSPKYNISSVVDASSVSYTQYYPDYFLCSGTSTIYIYGGWHSTSSYNGIFANWNNYTPSSGNGYMGSRLCRKQV